MLPTTGKFAMNRSSILIVEDDHDIRVSLRMALEVEGYSVSSAADGKQAMEMLLNGQCKPSLIILDLMMPLVNGWQVLDQLKAHPQLSRIPVLVTSAAGNKSKVKDVMGFVPKPINLDYTLDLIAMHQAPERFRIRSGSISPKQFFQ
jgi:CheY-like chemotaxis protein